VTETEFLARYCADLPEGLAVAVIEQSGGWEMFSENAPDIAAHGIDGGFSGWIYTADTVKFARVNRDKIVDWLISTAEDFGAEPVAMVQSWRCMEGCTLQEILWTIAGTSPDETVANGLAWAVAEDVARRFSDACEG
jgi:hypothetical protein